MAAALPFALGFLLLPLIAVCARAGGWWTWVPVAVTFLVVPAVDRLVGDNHANPPGDGLSRLDANPWFRIITWAWVPAQLVVVAWALAGTAQWQWPAHAWVGLAFSVGVATGTIGITYAHELVHRTSPWERALGEILLTTVSYPHFAIEHVYGHHRHVATPADPATARAGESFYRFLPRTLAGGLASACRLEAGRMRRRHGRVWHPANRLLRYGLVQGVLYPAVWLAWGPGAALLLAAQAAVAVTQLEVINYIEHYGLVRREVSPGVYERVQAHHSWDSHSRVSNWLLINLARHADHHCLASRRYQTLHVVPQAPELPAGYGAMFLLALVPPLWRRVMDPRVEAWRRTHAA
ncbi:MAG: alkane 1-monooxygenase [Acidobacteriota bacterium]